MWLLSSITVQKRKNNQYLFLVFRAQIHLVERLEILGSVLASAMKVCPDRLLHFIEVNELFMGAVISRRENEHVKLKRL